MVIENKPGAGATIGADFVAKSPPDGYTLLWTTPGPQITNPFLMPKLPYDPFRDFTPVATVVTAVNVLVVTPSLPVKSVAELIAYAKANPGKINFSSSGVGASSHLSGELFKTMAGIDIVHVPYRGSGPALQDLLAGNIQMAIDTVSVQMPHIQAGTLRGLAVATLERNPNLPDLPPIADTLPGFDGSSINYINGPAGLPQPIVDRLNSEINAILSDPEIAKRMEVAGFTPIIESQPALVKRIAARAGEVEEGDRADQVAARMPLTDAGPSRPARSRLRPRPRRRGSTYRARPHRRRLQRRNRAVAIAFIAPPDVFQDRCLIGRLTGRLELRGPAPRPHLGRRNDEDLHVRIRADDGSDVAPVEHRAGRCCGEIALKGEERRTHLRNRRHDRGRFADGVAFQNFLIERARIERARGRHGLRLVVKRASRVEQRLGHRAIDQPGIEMAQPEMRSEPFSEGALARGGGSVDRDDHARFE